MNLSEQTLQILNNFAMIQPNLVFRPGTVVKTMADAKNIVASATLETEIPQEFGVYDLSSFLKTLSLVDNPVLKLEKEHALISDSSGRSRIKYFYSDPEFLTSPTRDIVLPSEEVKFVLDANTLGRLKKASATLGHDEVVIRNDKGVLVFSVQDAENKTSNQYSLDHTGEFAEKANFSFVFNINLLKILPGDYEVALSKKLISHFKCKTLPVEYWIALEKTSEYDG